MSSISIIIPTLNEERDLPRTLRLLQRLTPQPLEVIIVDGGSTDRTCQFADALRPCFRSLQIIGCAEAGRARQMNAGAAQATGDILCFLHADTALPDDALLVIQHTLNDPKTAAGGFISLMRGPSTTRWVTSFHNYIKTYYAPLLFRPRLFFRGARLLFGDQVIFCRRGQFEAVGGYDSRMPIMEEADLLIRLVPFGRVRQVNRVVESSDRRVAAWGFWKANRIYLAIGMLWGLGYPPEKLKRWFEDVR
ncbi:TIGR04283 family arsenosugar biosynthesis glycosyltransferase [Spirosoma rigui]|uniref:TIGR04283 family arsenosugar biosynthesis glycosyltransferase n=1 Tax=Spirosoma rigui TaxID=564064 RepID=UPI0009B160B0|nr:TIGR04283 family arsenosugar biosynthesis glycosyltransferase [Spirosoma rigui]